MPHKDHPTTHPHGLLRPSLVAGLLVLTLFGTGCFRMVNTKTYAVGLETNRANLVIHTASTNGLYRIGKAGGPTVSRSVVLSQTPSKIPITVKQRAAICVVNLALCASADQIGRTLVSWFKSDIRNRGDFWEALSYAGQHGRCFAWTFAPSRNLTHKGVGTSGCKRGDA
ncbi:hypothetical protein [Aquihabitans sp. McL0605]|uniref:hypothetical protein n=1 Tax=Aquihabitans sp. McL0605 TaxID=3415671 RepID=UPI003CED98E0